MLAPQTEPQIVAIPRNLVNRVKALEEALTPSGETKAWLWGEFNISVEEANPEYDETIELDDIDVDAFENEELGRYIKSVRSPTRTVYHPVDWTTIKDIMKSILEYADGISPPNKN